MPLVWSCKESSLSLSLSLSSSKLQTYVKSTSTCLEPFESQGPRFLWGLLKYTYYTVQSATATETQVPNPWNQVIVLLCKGTWQASMVCSISLGVHHKIVTNIKHSTGQLPRACQVSHGFLGDIQEISNQTRCRNFFSQGSVRPFAISIIANPWLTDRSNMKLAKPWHVGKCFLSPLHI